MDALSKCKAGKELERDRRCYFLMKNQEGQEGVAFEVSGGAQLIGR